MSLHESFSGILRLRNLVFNVSHDTEPCSMIALPQVSRTNLSRIRVLKSSLYVLFGSWCICDLLVRVPQRVG